MFCFQNHESIIGNLNQEITTYKEHYQVTIDNNEVLIIQAKCWSHNKIIRENSINQLYGTFSHYKIKNLQQKVKALLFTTTSLSETARDFANTLDVTCYENFEWDKTSPYIKCHSNTTSPQKNLYTTYHSINNIGIPKWI